MLIKYKIINNYELYDNTTIEEKLNGHIIRIRANIKSSIDNSFKEYGIVTLNSTYDIIFIKQNYKQLVYDNFSTLIKNNDKNLLDFHIDVYECSPGTIKKKKATEMKEVITYVASKYKIINVNVTKIKKVDYNSLRF